MGVADSLGGRQAFSLYLQCHADLQFQMAWLSFCLGSLSSLKDDPARGLELADAIRGDITDLLQSAARLGEVAEGLLVNAARNLEGGHGHGSED